MSRLQLFWERSGSSLIHLSSYTLGKQNCQLQCLLKSVFGSWLKIKYHSAAAEAVKVPVLSFSLCPSPFDLQRKMNEPCDLASFQIKPGTAAGSWASVTGWEGHNRSWMGRNWSCLPLAMPCLQQTTLRQSSFSFQAPLGLWGSALKAHKDQAVYWCNGFTFIWQDFQSLGSAGCPGLHYKSFSFTSKTFYFTFLLSNHICSAILWETVVLPSQIQAASPKSLTGVMPPGWQGSDATSSVLLKPAQLHASLRLLFLLANAGLLWKGRFFQKLTDAVQRVASSQWSSSCCHRLFGGPALTSHSWW